MDVRKQLDEIRKQKHMTLSNVAMRSGLAWQTVRSALRGNKRGCELTTIVQIAEALNCELVVKEKNR